MPYIFLGLAAIVMLVVAVRHKASPLLAWSFVTTGGAITIGDLFVTGILLMYMYKPGFLPKYPDNYLGVLIAECLFVPAYYTCLSSFSGRYRYLIYCLAVIPILLLEVLFLHLGVYVHRTWTFWHSTILFLLYSLVAAYAAGSFQRTGYSTWHRLMVVASTVYYAMNLWGLLPFGILRLARMHLYIVEPDELDHVLTSLLLHAVPFTLTGILGTWYRLNHRPAFLVAVGLAFALWITQLQRWGIWTAQPPWNPWLAGFLISLVQGGIGWVDRWFSAHVPRRIPPWEPPREAIRPRR